MSKSHIVTMHDENYIYEVDCLGGYGSGKIVSKRAIFGKHGQTEIIFDDENPASIRLKASPKSTLSFKGGTL